LQQRLRSPLPVSPDSSRPRLPSWVAAGVAAAAVTAALGLSASAASAAVVSPPAAGSGAAASGLSLGGPAVQPLGGASAPLDLSGQASPSPLDPAAAQLATSSVRPASQPDSGTPGSAGQQAGPGQSAGGQSAGGQSALGQNTAGQAAAGQAGAGSAGRWHHHSAARPYEIYDSVTPTAIPAGKAVATYSTGPFAIPASQVAGRSYVLWIDVNGSNTRAAALDVEPGDATPHSAANWAWRKLHANPGGTAIIYTMRSEWPATQAAVSRLPSWMQSRVQWWIADPTGYPHLVPGSSATQWYWGSKFDISSAEAGFWPSR
jgi:hypothetical protein